LLVAEPHPPLLVVAAGSAGGELDLDVVAGADPSIGSIGDGYDNALAETTIGLYKTELTNRRGPWKTIDQVELATLEWVDWYNHRRLHSACDGLPPVEFEQTREREVTP
jgi:putative transposase